MKTVILSNEPLTGQVFRMVLSCPEGSGIPRPGQFVQLALPGRYLRRPISVCDWTESSLTLVYKVVGEGTADMARMVPGTSLDILTGLGNGFDTALCGDSPLLVGGGVGLPPLFGLAKALKALGKQVTVAVGFNTASEAFLLEDFAAAGIPVLLATMDGSAGITGLVTEAMKQANFDSVCACGPLPMLKAVYDFSTVPGQFSFEERMGCGFGACMGCTVKTKRGYKRICKDGPVLEREEILW